MHFLCKTLNELWGQQQWQRDVPLYTRSVYSRADTQQMLSSYPSSSLQDHVMESNRAAFCFRPQTGLVAGPRSVHRAVLAGSKEHEKRSLAERKPENQKSTSAATNLHQRAHWARCGGARPRHQNVLPTTRNNMQRAKFEQPREGLCPPRWRVVDVL
jgi:hypothetical protein